MPHVIDGPKGPTGSRRRAPISASLRHGLGRPRVRAGPHPPRRPHGLDRALHDGKKGIRRLDRPELRLKDQDRDGVQAEVLYGILGATGRLNDRRGGGRDDARLQRVARRLLLDAPRALRRASPRSRTRRIDAAIAEVERVAKRGAVRGLDIANSPDMKPLWDPYWNPLWEVINASGPAAALPHDRQPTPRGYPEARRSSAPIPRARPRT